MSNSKTRPEKRILSFLVSSFKLQNNIMKVCIAEKPSVAKEIADKLNISLTTVISHRKNITEKLGIKSVAGLTIYAVMHGYVEADRI